MTKENRAPNILAIESSCDETSVAVLRGGEVASNVISSQIFHTRFGGVVPELASRAHVQLISKLLTKSLEDAQITLEEIDALAVTVEPGLIGSLVVGANFAKGLALRHDKPLIPVNHIEGHIYSGILEDSSVEFPFVCLVVSGGHTAIFWVESYSEYKLLGSTRDDAAGEAFDKTAKLLGLGYPGGPLIDRYAQQGNPQAIKFPRGMMEKDSFDFSFSGLKTSVRSYVQGKYSGPVPEEDLPDICASVQEAIADVLTKKSLNAARKFGAKAIVIAGGVSANSSVRAKMAEAAARHHIRVVAPRMELCTDNAAMIGFVAAQKFRENPGAEEFSSLDFVVRSVPIRAKRK